MNKIKLISTLSILLLGLSLAVAVSPVKSDIWSAILNPKNIQAFINATRPPKPPKKPKPLAFPFNRLVGVTQWHGNTAYQKPHTGIDFGAVKLPVFSPANGRIRAIGWDNYYGRCHSGGNFVRIQHDNGLHTVYFHLLNYQSASGKNWRVGDRIWKGQKVGVTGNTGAYNCQTLGYHLHFEVRRNSKQSSHVNPVSYVQVDWNKIPTLGWKSNPGRLTGNNPHPKF